MKKLLIVLALLIAAGAVVFAEPEISGELMLGATDLFTPDISTSALKAELNIDAAIDENTTVNLELDSEGADWAGQETMEDDPATEEDETASYHSVSNISVDDFRVTSNLAGALGVDTFDVNVTVGLFDTYFCNWNYVSRSGEEYYYSTPAGDYLWTQGQMQPSTDLAFAVDLGYAGYNLMYWLDFAASHMNIAVAGEPVEGANFLIGYYGEMNAFTDGNLWIEAGYNIDAGAVSLFVPASFTYDIDGAAAGWSSGIAADIETFHVSAGIGGASDTSLFKDCLVEISTSAVENADIYAIADMDFNESTPFQSIDIGGKYNFGAFGVGVGYVAASSEDVATVLWSDSTSMTGSGLYLLADVDF